MRVPLISIIVPVYNSEKTLSNSLSKICSQSFENFELVVIDGKSSDGSLGIVKNLAERDQRIRLFSDYDKGIYDAMNKGIDKALGEWMLFLGSDDELFDDKVLAQVFPNLVETRENIIYGNVKIVGNASWASDGTIYDGPFDLKKLLNKNICHQAIFYRTEFIKSHVGYYNIKYRLCGDWDFNLRCWSKSPFQFVDKIIANFHAGGETTRTLTDEAFTNEYLQNVLSYFKISPFDEKVNDPKFIDYPKVCRLQKKQNYLRYLFNRVQRKLAF